MLLVLGLLSGPALADEVQLASGAVLEARLGSYDRAGDCALEVTGGELEGALVVIPCADIERFRRVETGPAALSGEDELSMLPVFEEAAPLQEVGPAAELESLAVDAGGPPPVILIGDEEPELLAEALPPPAASPPLMVQEPVEAPEATAPVVSAAPTVSATQGPAPLPPTPAVDPAAKLALPETAPVRRASLPGHLSPPGSSYEAPPVEAPVSVEAPGPVEVPEGTVAEPPRLDPSPQEAPQSAAEPEAGAAEELPGAGSDGLADELGPEPEPDGAPFPRLRQRVGTVVEGWYSGAEQGEATLEE